MTTPLLERIRRGDVIVGDGAWGTMLIDRGLPPGRPPESWTLERPETISEIARQYLDAGAEIITTNTFGGSPFRLRQYGLADRIDEINTRAVTLALAVARDRACVSASVGPSGALLKPVGEADPAEIRDGFVRQIQALTTAGAEIICVETMTDVTEAALAITAARQSAPEATVIATMTFDLTPRGPFTVMGVSVDRAARMLEDAGADIIGANCGSGINAMLEVSRAFRAATRLPLAVRPNAGLPQRRGGRLVYAETPEDFAKAAVAFLTIGVDIIGGCCGTTPAHIRALSAAVRGARDRASRP